MKGSGRSWETGSTCARPHLLDAKLAHYHASLCKGGERNILRERQNELRFPANLDNDSALRTMCMSGHLGMLAVAEILLPVFLTMFSFAAHHSLRLR